MFEERLKLMAKQGKSSEQVRFVKECECLYSRDWEQSIFFVLNGSAQDLMTKMEELKAAHKVEIADVVRNVRFLFSFCVAVLL
jgi:hypothetical protein